jgi:excisionase family DNA binding protein
VQPQHTSATIPEWLDKHEAAERLGISTRTVLALASAGKIKTQRIRDPKSNQVAVQFNAGDVERYGYERDHPKPEPALAVQQQRAVCIPPQASHTPKYGSKYGVEPRLFLTIGEAAAYSGIPAGLLLDLIDGGEIRAIDAKHRVRGGWLIARRVLDAYEGESRT